MKKKPAPFPVVVSHATPPDSERNLYLSDWRHSLRDTPAMSAMPSSAYKAYFDGIASFYLGAMDGDCLRLPQHVKLLTLRKADRPSYVVGWTLLDQAMQGMTAIVYAYVKRDLRNCGYGSLLLSAVLDAAHDDNVVHVLRPRVWVDERCQDYGFDYAPLDQLMRAERRRAA